MHAEEHTDLMDKIRHLVWLSVHETTVKVLPLSGLDDVLRMDPPLPDPDKVWTLNGLLRSPAPLLSLPRILKQITLHLQRTLGGTLGLVAHQGTLYLSEWKPGLSPSPLDVEHARRLGWVGDQADLLVSWQESKI
jgi:hypothetical protein